VNGELEVSIGLIKILSQHLPGGTEENHKTWFWVADVCPKIQTEYLLNINMEPTWFMVVLTFAKFEP
jgi:hypothetical protein